MAEVIGNNRAQLHRLRFIDFLLDYYGAFNRQAVMDFFGLSTPQVSIDIQAYLALAPGNAVYNKSSRQYERTDTYQRKIP
jgi:hypothetical protein